jgi:hypothetical protein
MNTINLKEKVIESRLEKGWTYSRITEVYGVAKSTARDWVAPYLSQEEPPSSVVGYTNDTFQRDKIKRPRKTDDEILSFLTELAPIKVESNYSGVVSPLNNFAVVGSDFHFGCHDEPCVNIFLATIEELKPKTIVLNGDTMDMLAISKYPKDIKKKWSLMDERKAYHQFLDDLISVAGGAEIYETVSNHSGQSIDGRWRRYLSERLGELGSLPDISDKLSYENIFMGEYQEYVKHVDYVDLNGLIVTHGTTVRSAGGASAKGEIEKWQTSILHGHTHRIGSSCKRVPAFGNRQDKQMIGIEGGCLCSLDAAYGTHLNWQNGFNIIGLGDDTDSFSIEQIYIMNGRANISTLGQTIVG